MTQLVPYSFDEIQEVLKSEAVSSGLVSDSSYEGSNIAQLIRIMAYAVQSCNINTTYGVNEMLLTQTTEYNNALKLARQLGYVPKQKVSYRYNITLRPNTEGRYKIPKYTEFKSGNYSYYYFGADVERVFEYYIEATFTNPPNTSDGTITGGVTVRTGSEIVLSNNKTGKVLAILPSTDNATNKRLVKLEFNSDINEKDVNQEFIICDDNGTITNGVIQTVHDTRYENLEVKEGIFYRGYDEESYPGGKKDLFHVITDTIIEDGVDTGEPLNYIDLNYYDIEEDGVELAVTHFNEAGQLKIKEKYHKRDYFIVDKDIFEEQNTFLPLINIDLKTLRIYFKIADTGVTPKLYSKVYINILKTNGSKGRAIKPFEFVTLSDEIWTFKDPENLQLITTGKDKENIDKIKENAPTFHNTGNRAVTRNDYISICNRDNGIEQTQVWGGEDDLPKVHLGHIFFSFLPSTRPKEFLSDLSNSVYTLKRTKVNDSEFNLKDDEIWGVNIQSNSYVDESNVGIFDTLQSYKIITMDLHHVWNMYLDIDLGVDVRRYYVTQSSSSLNETLFLEIKNYFQTIVETYDYDFFRSNIVRIIDETLGITSGIELKMQTSISLFPKHLKKVIELQNAYDIDIWFGYPYDGVIDEYGGLEYDSNTNTNPLLPIIDTPNFLRDNKELYIRRVKNITNINEGFKINKNGITEIDICLGENKNINVFNQFIPTPSIDDVVGTLYINDKDKTFLIKLRVKDSTLPIIQEMNCELFDTSKYDNTIITNKDFELVSDTGISREPLKIIVNYPYNDINFHRNTIPRLNTVRFY